jgi:protein kinase-like protein/NACHT domain-containing protein
MGELFKYLTGTHFQVGVLLGAVISVCAAIAKKQIEEHASELFAHVPGLFKKLISFRVWEKRYRHAIVDEHRYLRFVGLQQQLELMPPRLEDVYLDLELQSPSSLGEHEHLQPTLSLRDTFRINTVLNKFTRIVILGGPGTGKTTLLEHLVAVHGRRGRKQRGNALLPMYVPLRRCLLNGRSLVEEVTDPQTGVLIPELLKRYPKGFFETRLEAGKCLILFDGMDEVLDESRHVAASRLVDTCAVLYPESRIIVTSRIAGWRGLLRANFSRFVVRELAREEMVRLVHQWYLAVLFDKAKTQVLNFTEEVRTGARRQAADMAAQVSEIISGNPRLCEIANTPLILSLMCLVYYTRHDLPERRAQLYEECSRVLLEEWDEADKQLPGLSLSYEHKKLVLQRIATYLFRNAAAEISGDDLSRQLEVFLQETGNTINGRLVLRHLQERSGLLVEKSIDTYGFAHLTFQEYFTALGLLNMPDGLTLLLSTMRTRAVQEIILLYAGAAKCADPLLQSLVDEYRRSRRRDQIVAAGLAVAESRAVSLEVKAGITALLNQEFDSTKDADVLLELQAVLRRIGVNRDVIRTFDEYTVVRELGRGGFGTTYLAIERNTGANVALKIYRSGTGSYVRDMAEEIERLKKIRHPALVSVLGVGKSEDLLFVTMQFVEGRSLGEVQDRQRAEFGRTSASDSELGVAGQFPHLVTRVYYEWLRSILSDIADGVGELHKHGLIHGDLKPSNVLLEWKGDKCRARVSDFSVDAIIMRRQSGISRTRSGSFPFSPQYVAPEILFSRGPIQASADVYSMGVVASESLLLMQFFGHFEKSMALSPLPIDRGLLEHNNLLRQVERSGLQQVLATATSEDPHRRQSSLAQLSSEIDNCLAQSLRI